MEVFYDGIILFNGTVFDSVVCHVIRRFCGTGMGRCDLCLALFGLYNRKVKGGGTWRVS
jgi:hypothetical protein